MDSGPPCERAWKAQSVERETCRGPRGDPRAGPAADRRDAGPDDLFTLVLEVTGEARKEKQAKVATAEHLWTVAVNNWGGAGRWAFLEITDPWDAEHLIRARFLEPAAVSR